jgi:hypothetical protein
MSAVAYTDFCLATVLLADCCVLSVACDACSMQGLTEWQTIAGNVGRGGIGIGVVVRVHPNPRGDKTTSVINPMQPNEALVG